MIVPMFHQAMVNMKAQKSQFKRRRASSRITKASPRGMAMPSILMMMEVVNSADIGPPFKSEQCNWRACEKRASQKLRFIQKGYYHPQYYFIPKKQFGQESERKVLVASGDALY
jgi:hypothetical protein